MDQVGVLLRLTRALRSGDWKLYLTSFAEMIPWFHLYDHTNYTRWATIFLADTEHIEERAPVVYEGFLNGGFVVKETNHKFNQLPDDQALEHINKLGKVAGGLVGITRTDSARDRWSLIYNERMHIAKSTWTMFGLQPDSDHDDLEWDHKDMGASRKHRDEQDVIRLREEFKAHNVFTTTTSNLINISNGDVATNDITESLLNAKNKGHELSEAFIYERLIKKQTSYHKTLHRVKSKTFESLYEVNITYEKQKNMHIKADRDLFRRLVVAVESGRDIELDTLLLKELSPVPLSLANTNGTLRSTNKAQLAHLLEEGNIKQSLPESSLQECTIIDGMDLIHSLGKLPGLKTFGELVDVVTKMILSNLKGNCFRVDVVFDQYNAKSIKSGTRIKRHGCHRPVRRLVQDRNLKLPDNWQNFLAMNDNKRDLVDLLSKELSKVHLDSGHELIVSGGFLECKRVVSTDLNHDVTALSSTHEEGDTRVILHAIEASKNGYERIVVIARDTDILILLLAYNDSISAKEIWMKCGTKQKPRFTAIHAITLPENIRKNMLQFHALTGCDSTSQFTGIGKRSAWGIFCNNNNSELLYELGGDHTLNTPAMARVEEFVCRLYKPGTSITSIQALRSVMFRTSKKALESLIHLCYIYAVPITRLLFGEMHMWVK